MVVCPKNIIGSWEDELESHVEDYQVLISLKDLDLIDYSFEYTFVVLNYEQVRIHIDELIEVDWDFVIIDESLALIS